MNSLCLDACITETLKSHLAQITATYPLHPSQETEEVV